MKIDRATNIPAVDVELGQTKDVKMKLHLHQSDGAENFLMRMFEIKPASYTPLHNHPREHEVFILGGKGTFRLRR